MLEKICRGKVHIAGVVIRPAMMSMGGEADAARAGPGAGADAGWVDSRACLSGLRALDVGQRFEVVR